METLGTFGPAPMGKQGHRKSRPPGRKEGSYFVGGRVFGITRRHRTQIFTTGDTEEHGETQGKHKGNTGEIMESLPVLIRPSESGELLGCRRGDVAVQISTNHPPYTE